GGAPVAFRGQRSVDRVRLATFAFRSGLILGIELDESLFDRELRRGVLLTAHDDRLAMRSRTTVGVAECHVDRVIARPRIEVDPDRRLPALADRDEGHSVPAPLHGDA